MSKAKRSKIKVRVKEQNAQAAAVTAASAQESYQRGVSEAIEMRSSTSGQKTRAQVTSVELKAAPEQEQRVQKPCDEPQESLITLFEQEEPPSLAQMQQEGPTKSPPYAPAHGETEAVAQHALPCEPERVTEKVVAQIIEPVKKKKRESSQKMPVFTPFADLSPLRKILVVLLCIFCLWTLVPLCGGIIGIGTYAPLTIGLFLLAVTFCWDYITSRKGLLWSVLRTLVAVVFLAGAVSFAYVSGLMISASRNYVPSYSSNVTLVVLGCKVNGDQPSLMLERRLEAAADYMLKNPDSNCIVTGGQGPDEDYPEAVIMKRRLTELGVSASRIKTEDKSTSTRENLTFAMEKIAQNKYSSTIAVVTDPFHQLRASMICEELEVSHYAICSNTPWYLVMYYWFREMFGIARLWLLGY